jgi:hypothetical protein
MNPGMRMAGLAGMMAGVLLGLETGAVLLSGWSPEKFDDPALALELLHQGGMHLRAAAVFGFAGLLTTTFLVAGLATALHDRAPALATGTLYLGLIGIAGYSLVPLSLWVGIPTFLTLASQNPALAQSGWAAFAAVSDGAQGIGMLFMGCSMLLAGMAVVAKRTLSRAFAWMAITAGALTLATLLTVGTPLAAFGGALFTPALVCTVLFRFWAGVVLWNSAA